MEMMKNDDDEKEMAKIEDEDDDDRRVEIVERNKEVMKAHLRNLAVHVLPVADFLARVEALHRRHEALEETIARVLDATQGPKEEEEEEDCTDGDEKEEEREEIRSEEDFLKQRFNLDGKSAGIGNRSFFLEAIGHSGDQDSVERSERILQAK